MHRLIDWFINYSNVNELHDLWWRHSVTNPNLMRLEHIPIELRLTAIDKLTPLIDKANNEETKNSINDVISALRSTEVASR
jgi:hypothetical protein